MTHLVTDVLVIGAGGAGMYGAIAAAREGARVLLIDKSLIGRGGATVMAQMTVAVALGHESEDDWSLHLADTLAAGRGLCDEPLAEALCRDASARILEMDSWRVGWAAEDGDGPRRLRQITAPGHGRPRCVWVDFLNTGPAVSRTLRNQVHRMADRIRRVADLNITDLVVEDGRCYGAVGFEMATGDTVTIEARATVLATGGLTRLYARNSASLNMGGDGYALALRAGAELIDMEFVQFFPIGHLAPRLVGMDPIMWDPFRYKLGGLLLNGDGEEFVERYGGQDGGHYTMPRDQITYAILKEVEAGRGSPAGGVYLSFTHIPEADLRAAFGPVIDRLAANGIDLTKQPVEVAPIAHYHMGGIRVDTDMATQVEGLFAAGEAVGGANGANRLSGNAITEALVFGERAGRAAAAVREAGAWPNEAAKAANGILDTVLSAEPPDSTSTSPAARIAELQALMAQDVGPFRTETGLTRALGRLDQFEEELGGMAAAVVAGGRAFNMVLGEWFELRGMLQTARAVTQSALSRTESRGAHQREDFEQTDPAWEVNQVATLRDDGSLALERAPVPRLSKPLEAAVGD